MDDSSAKHGKRRFQFHLATLFVSVTIAAVVFALIGRFGINGLMERLGAAITVAGVVAPLAEFYYWRKRDIED